MLRRLMIAVLAVLVPALSGAQAPAPRAEDPAVAQRLADLEAQVKFLTQELQRLRPDAAAPAPASSPQDVAQLTEKVDALAEEVSQRRLGISFAKPLDSHWGLGPAASKVYGVEHGVSVGGYGEMLYQSYDGDRDDGTPSGKKDTADMLRAVLYVGYRFSDRVLFNSEIEFEHANTEHEGEVEVELAAVDFLVKDAFNVRAGMVLVPVGLTNEMHEPTTFWSARRPQVESVIIPTTWSENGVGFFGEAGRVSYRAYVLAGLDAAGFSAGEGIRDGRQGGSKSLAEDLAFTARLDVDAAPGLKLGFSGYVGQAGQDAKVSGETIDAEVSLWEAHAAYQWRGLGLRALYAEGHVGDAAQVNELLGLAGDESVGSRLKGWYAEAGWDVFSHRDTERELIPFVRYESFDTQADVPSGFLRDAANEREIWTLGLAFKPHPQVVIKLDWQDIDNAAGTGTDQLNFAVGYAF